MAGRRPRDLIERVRYPNPLPEVPYAPKLVRVDAPAPNYTTPVYAQRISEAQQLPVAVDAEGGMPVDLPRFEYLWQDDARQPAGLDEELDMEAVHPEDAYLLSDALTQETTPVGLLSEDAAARSASAQAASVTWLRRTEYLGAEQRRQRAAEAKPQALERLDTSTAAQTERIKLGFAAANRPLNELRHPSKPDVHAVEAHELLPVSYTHLRAHET